MNESKGDLKMKRFLSLFLSLLMIFSCMSVMFSCSDKPEGIVRIDDEEDKQEDKEDGYEEDPDYVAEEDEVLGDVDFTPVDKDDSEEVIGNDIGENVDVGDTDFIPVDTDGNEEVIGNDTEEDVAVDVDFTPAEKDDVKTEPVDDGSIFYERSLVDDELGEYDYGGRTFRVVCVNYAENNYVAPDENVNQGNLILDAKYDCIQKVQNRFNVNFDVVYSGMYSEIDSYVTKTVLSASDEFDLMEGMTMSMGGLVIKGLFWNWYDIEHIDFSKPWWYEANSTDLTYDGKSVLAISHLNYSATSGSYCIFYNKDLARQYGLGNLYDEVLRGEWTFDRFNELVKDVYVDNGNNVRDTNDTYGMVQGLSTEINSYLWAFDNPVCTKDADGVPQISVKTDKIDDIVNSVYDFCYNTTGVWCDPDASAGSAYVSEMFYGNKALFAQMALSSATSEEFRYADFPVGILPLPKWDVNQTEYKTMVGGSHTALAVPKTAPDTEFVGRIVEALSAESWKTVTPTLYEIALKTRYLRGSEDKQMLDIIIDGTQFDFGTVYDNWQGFAFTLQFMMGEKNNDFSSYYSKKSANAIFQIQKTVRAFDKLG